MTGELPRDYLEMLREHLVHPPAPAAPHLRFMPATPCEAGNPVFSVMQTGIIHSGNDLADYLHNEFSVPLPDWAATAPKPIPFWDTVVYEEGAIRNW
jgi:hypothetical protein